MPKPGANAQGLFGMRFIAFHRLVAWLGPCQRLRARIGIQLDHIAVRIADKNRMHALEAELARQFDSHFLQKPLGRVHRGNLERDMGDAGMFLVNVHQDIGLGRGVAGAQ